jgi:hypothetical protein
LAVSFSRIRVYGYRLGRFDAADNSKLEETLEMELSSVVLAAVEL